MSASDWDILGEVRQQQLIAAGRTSAELPPPTASTNKPQIEVHSPKAKALLARLAEAKEHTYALQQLWISLEICPCPPDSKQFHIWYKHEFETIVASFEATAVWLSKLRGGEHPETADEKTHDHKIRYASAVMNRIVNP